MLRCRFKANGEDYRSINWPVKYPYWCTGSSGNYSIVVAYADNLEYIYENWPEAKDVDVEERENITFSGRFPKPDWYQE